MITWRNILESLSLVDDARLDDPAYLLCNDDYVPMDVVEIEFDEIGDTRLVAVPLDEMDEET